MHTHRHEESMQILDVSFVSQYLNRRRRGIYGPRTLKQAYADCRMLMISNRLKGTDQEQEDIRRMDPRRVDWVAIYAWWKDRDASL